MFSSSKKINKLSIALDNSSRDKKNKKLKWSEPFTINTTEGNQIIFITLLLLILLFLF